MDACSSNFSCSLFFLPASFDWNGDGETTSFIPFATSTRGVSLAFDVTCFIDIFASGDDPFGVMATGNLDPGDPFGVDVLGGSGIGALSCFEIGSPGDDGDLAKCRPYNKRLKRSHLDFHYERVNLLDCQVGTHSLWLFGLEIQNQELSN